MTKTIKTKKVLEPTISNVLFEQIKFLRRTTDAGELVALTGSSRPVVDNALNYGYILDASLEKAIISFYIARAEQHTAAEIRINNLLTHKLKK